VSEERVWLDGELYLALETVAEIYRVRYAWLREVYDLGLLGRGVDRGTTLCIGAVELDHVATIVRLHTVLGLDARAIRRELGARATR
jgi:hypothetical protein